MRVGPCPRLAGEGRTRVDDHKVLLPPRVYVSRACEQKSGNRVLAASRAGGERTEPPSTASVSPRAQFRQRRESIRERTSSPIVATSVRSRYCVAVVILAVNCRRQKFYSDRFFLASLTLSHKMASANDNGVRTATIAWKSDNGTSARVAVGRTGDHLVLAAADQLSQEERAGNAYISALSVIVPEDPFPGFSTAGNQMIWVSSSSRALFVGARTHPQVALQLKDYSENEGLAPQLEKAGMLRRSVASLSAQLPP